MFLQYGNYIHAIGECWISISQQAVEVNGLLTATNVRYDVSGRLQIPDQGSPLANQAYMTPLLGALEDAYSVDGFDFGLYEDDGTPTQHTISSALTLGGTRVTRPVSYNNGRGAEYSTFRNYQLTIEATLPNLFAGLIDWQESIHFVGGGPRDVWLECLTGEPIKQTPCEQTTYKATQSGVAIGMYSFVNPSDPIWPDALHVDRAMVSYASPKRAGASGLIVFSNYRTEWNYDFEDSQPLVGLPNFWGSDGYGN